jgi:hypothetical protein
MKHGRNSRATVWLPKSATAATVPYKGLLLLRRAAPEVRRSRSKAPPPGKSLAFTDITKLAKTFSTEVQNSLIAISAFMRNVEHLCKLAVVSSR